MDHSRRLFAHWSAAAALAALSLAGTRASAQAAADLSITDTVARTPHLATLGKLIGDAGLADTLRGAGPYTLFAPSDEAFGRLPPKTVAELAADKELLKAVLTYHAVAGRAQADDIRAGNLKTVNGAELSVARAGSYVTVDDAVVQQQDIVASNGVIHVVDRVLMPPKR